MALAIKLGLYNSERFSWSDFTIPHGIYELLALFRSWQNLSLGRQLDRLDDLIAMVEAEMKVVGSVRSAGEASEVSLLYFELKELRARMEDEERVIATAIEVDTPIEELAA